MQNLAILALVVTLGIGPTGANLCRAFCAAEQVGPQCHETLAAVVAGDCCDRPAIGATAVAGSESRPQHMSTPPNVRVLQRSGAAPAASARSIGNQPQGLNTNSLATVLRI